MTNEYKSCTLCPRNCNIDRSIKKGFCGMSDKITVARAALHFWEEPCISGENGSGTVFFSGCPLKCIYCQNSDISGGFGKAISIERLSDIFLELQNKKAHNINLVTPTHFSPGIITAVKKARENGLTVPIVYNTSGYEKEDIIEKLKDTVDIYLTDFKYTDEKIAQNFSFAPDYPEAAKKALAKMVETAGEIRFDENGIMQKGVIVRHLVLPGHIENSKQTIKYLFETYGDDIILSIMNQFTPKVKTKYHELDRTVRQEEYDEVIDYALSLGIEDAFIQEGETASESFIPAFDLEGV